MRNRSRRGPLLFSALAFVLSVLTLLFACASPSFTASAQAPTGGGGGTMGADDDSSKVRLAFVPIPNYNSTLGWGIGVFGAAFYKLRQSDTVSPPSMSAVGGFYAENKTYVAALMQTLYLKEDTYRVELIAAYASINFQFYTNESLPIIGGKFIDYNTGNVFIRGEGSRRTWGDLFLGLLYRYRDVQTGLGLDILPPEWTSWQAIYAGPGLVVSFDSRDNVYNARTGWYLDFSSFHSHESLGSDENFNRYNLRLSRYWSLSDRRVIAALLTSEIGTGDVPFDEESIIGANNLRGYTSGKYRDAQTYTAQAEYRWRFWRRWGVAAFAGFGYAVEKPSEIAWDDTLPSAGFGFRYMMVQEYQINVRVDVAWGKDDRGIYFMIGEAF